MRPAKIVEDLDGTVKVAGLANISVTPNPKPHRHAGERHQEPRQIAGTDPQTIDHTAAVQVLQVVSKVPRATSHSPTD